MNSQLTARVFDRRLFRATAIVFAAIVLAGFARTYYLKVLVGGPPLPSTLVHVHGLLMTMWVVLFGVQVWLISSRNIRWHQRLGYSAVGLAVLLVAAAFVTALRAAKYGSASTPAGIPPLAFLAVPLFDLVMFVVLFGGAIYYRRRPAAHKTLMLLTAVNFLPPAIARIPITPLQELGPLWFFGFPTIVVAFCVVIDWRRRGRPNAVFVAGAVLLVASYAGRLALMGTAGWMQAAAWLTSFV